MRRRHDQAQLELFEPDAVFVARPGRVLTGPDQIREGLSGFLATGGTMRITPIGSVAGTMIEEG